MNNPNQQQTYQQYQQQYANYYYSQQQQHYPQVQLNSLLSSVNQAIQGTTNQTQILQQQQPIPPPPQQQTTVYPSINPFYQIQSSSNYNNSYPNQTHVNSTYLQPHPQIHQNHIHTPYYPQNQNQFPNPNNYQPQFNYNNYNNNNNFNYNSNSNSNSNNNNNNRNNSSQIRNQSNNHSHRSEKFPCEQCNQVFYNLTSLSNHWRNHIKCDYENCKFEAIQHILDLHKEDRHLIFKPGRGPHVTNQTKSNKLDGPPNATIQGLGYALKTQEQIDRWIEERKKKWPSNRRIAEKLALAKEKEEEEIKKKEEKLLSQSINKNKNNDDDDDNEKQEKKLNDNSNDHHFKNNKKRNFPHSSDNCNKENTRNKKNKKKNDFNSSKLSFDRSGLFSKLIEKDIDQEVSDLYEVINFLSTNNFLDGFQTCLNPDESDEPSILEL